MTPNVLEMPHEETLRHLPVALDTAVMQAVFQQSFLDGQNGNPRLLACEIERIRYKPGQNCLICYRLRVQGKDGIIRDQWVTARMVEPGGAYSRYAKASRETLVSPLIGRAITHIPELDMVVWAFPNDRKLKGLHGLCDTARLETLLLPLVAEHFGCDWRIVGLEQEMAHYNPEHTCMIRVRAQLEYAQTGERQPFMLFGKVYDDDEGAETYRLMRELWDRKPQRLHIAQPLAYQADLKLLWQRALPGQTLLAFEAEASSWHTKLAQAAAAVAEFHQSGLFCKRSTPVSVWVTKLKDMRGWLPAVMPGCRGSVEALVDRLLAQSEWLGPQPRATLHGDLHLQNFFLDGEAIALIDLDNAGYGSPWQDVGSLIASLLNRGLILGTPEPVVWEVIAVFLNAYQQQAPWQIEPQALNWFIATALINERAFRCVTRLKESRLELVEELVVLATRLTGSRA